MNHNKTLEAVSGVRC